MGASAEVAVLAALMRVQLALLAGDSAAAVQLLGSLPNADLRHRPAVIATLASLQVSFMPWTTLGFCLGF